MGRTPFVELLQQHANRHQQRILDAAIELSSRYRTPLYLVGGVVRDLLLTGEVRDLDLTVEGDGIELGRGLAEVLGGRLEVHQRFLTAAIDVEGERVDVVTARRERYDEPAALPAVSPGRLVDDLARRDFSINAMALELWPQRSKALIDPFGGETALRRKSLVALYDRSFIDDPTRVVRGARFAARLGFELDPSTARLASGAIRQGAFQPLSADRLRREIALLLEDARPETGLRCLDRLGFYSVLGRAMPFADEDLEAFRAVWKLRELPTLELSEGQADVRWWLAGLMALSLSMHRDQRQVMARRLGITGEQERRLVDLGQTLKEALTVLNRPGVSVAESCAAIQTLSPEQRLVLHATGTVRVRAALDRWWREWQSLQLEIGGRDLVAAGFDSGPEIGLALEKTLTARREGRISAAEELAYAISMLRQQA